MVQLPGTRVVGNADTDVVTGIFRDVVALTGTVMAGRDAEREIVGSDTT